VGWTGKRIRPRVSLTTGQGVTQECRRTLGNLRAAGHHSVHAYIAGCPAHGTHSRCGRVRQKWLPRLCTVVSIASQSNRDLKEKFLVDNPGLPDALWRELDGGLRHATSRETVLYIVRSSEICVSTQDRYESSFCRCVGAVSLFDLGPAAVNDWNQFNNWSSWFGHQQCKRIAVWLEINRREVRDALMDAAIAHSEWKRQIHKNFIPGVEACHRGSIPIDAIDRCIVIDKCNHSLFHVINRD